MKQRHRILTALWGTAAMIAFAFAVAFSMVAEPGNASLSAFACIACGVLATIHDKLSQPAITWKGI